MSFLKGLYKWIRGGDITPLEDMIPGEIPGFWGSPYYELATTIEKWGPLRLMGNTSPTLMADYFHALGKDVLTTPERQLAASTVAWPLLDALNKADKENTKLMNENCLLKDRIRKLEEDISVLTGKKSDLPVSQIRTLSISDEQGLETTELPEQGKKNSKSNLEAPSEVDPLQLRPIISQKTKKVQDRPAGVPPDQWPPAETRLHVTARPYTSSELMDLVQRFRQGPKESIPTWLLRLWDSGAETVIVSGPELSKLATITVHPALRQRLYVAGQFPDDNHSIIEWIMAACRAIWPNKSDLPINSSLWNTMEDLQNYIRELGMREAIYEEAFDGPDMIRFSAGMRDQILQQAPSHMYGTLVAILNPLVASEAVVQQAAQIVADLGETERLRARRNVRTMEEEEEVFPVIKRPIPRRPKSGPIRVSRKQMFNDLIRAGVQFVKIDGQPNHVLLHLWKQLRNDQKFQNQARQPKARILSTIPTMAWNLEDFVVPARKRRPPRVARAVMTEPPVAKDLSLAQFMA